MLLLCGGPTTSPPPQLIPTIHTHFCPARLGTEALQCCLGLWSEALLLLLSNVELGLLTDSLQTFSRSRSAVLTDERPRRADCGGFRERIRDFSVQLVALVIFALQPRYLYLQCQDGRG